MLGGHIPGLDRLGDLVWNVIALKKVIDALVGDAEIRLVRLTGRVVKQVDRRCLQVEPLGRIEQFEK